MSNLRLRISILHYQPRGEPKDVVVGQVREALESAGHEVIEIPVDESVTGLLQAIRRSKCDLVFNICETFAEDYRMEVNVAALMEMARVNFTGSGTAGLLLAQDKILTKQLLEYHEVLTPKFATFDATTFETNGNLTFPLIVKPAKSDASLGLSVVKNWDELMRKVRAIREQYNDDALAEEFIEGREVYCGVIGEPTHPRVLPIVELDFGKKMSKKRFKIANREVKFGPEGKDLPKLLLPTDLTDELRGRIERSAIMAFRALKLRDYARVDFRVSAQTNEPYLLEVNPNPYLDTTCEVALGAGAVGIPYAELINGIVATAAKRYQLTASRAPKPPPAPSQPQSEPSPEPVH